jgi:hypothetical protein
MWAIFLIPLAVLAIAGSLLLGWGIPLLVLFGVALVAAALFFVFQRTAAEPATGTEAEGESKPSWATKHWWQ